MTAAASTPQVIVVAEPEVYDLLAASGAGWDVQHRVESVGQMWDDLSGGRLAQTSSVLVFSDQIPAQPGELEAALAAMAPHAAVFLVTWDPAAVTALLERVRASAVQQGSDPSAPLFPLPTGTGRDLLDGMAQVLGDRVAWPAQWPDGADRTLARLPLADPTPEPPSSPPTVAPDPQDGPAATAAAPPAPAPAVVPSPAPTPAPAAPAPRPGQVTLAVTSSKGGSGKSTTAMLVAAQIAQSSRAAGRPLRVVLVDMDTRDGQVASLIGRYVPTALNIRVAPDWDEETILRHLVHDPKLDIDALLAPVRPRTADDVGPDFYRHVIRVLQRTHDVVVMDTSVNYLDPLISTVCLPEATAILFVTTLATTSVQGMARALREITEPTEKGGMGVPRRKIGIVVNQSVTDVGMDRDQVLQAALRVPIVGAIPLATRDVLTATNHNRMHLLLKHPLLGPAYFRLATACLPGVPLVPMVADTGTAAAATGNGASPVAGPPPPAVPVLPDGSEPRRRRLFGRG